MTQGHVTLTKPVTTRISHAPGLLWFRPGWATVSIHLVGLGGNLWFYPLGGAGGFVRNRIGIHTLALEAFQGDSLVISDCQASAHATRGWTSHWLLLSS
jgi:hypothetical protein